MAAILVFQNNKTAAMLVYQTNPLGVQLFSRVNSFFCSNKFAWLLVTWLKTLHMNRRDESKNLLLYLLISTRAVIGQFSGMYSTVRPAKITKMLPKCLVICRQVFLTF